MRRLPAIIVGVLFLLGASPYLIGFGVEREYRNLIADVNKQGDIAVKIKEYHRYYFSSEVKLEVQPVSQRLAMQFEKIGLQKGNNQLTFLQYMQHGPFFFKKNENLPLWFGWVAIHNQLIAPKKFAKIAVIGLTEFLQSSEDMVSFLGNYFKHIETSFIQFSSPENDFSFHLTHGLKADIWYYPGESRVIASGFLPDLEATLDDSKLAISQMHIECDQQINQSGLLVGSLNFLIPSLSINQKSTNPLVLSELHLYEALKEKKKTIYVSSQMEINQIQLNKLMLGPMQLTLNASKLNKDVILAMIAAYKKISQEGEMYQDQLNKKIALLFPTIFSNGAEIRLHQFFLNSEAGTFLATGRLFWPTGLSPSSGIRELVGDAVGGGEIKASKELIHKLIDYFSQFSFFRSISRQYRDQLISSDEKIRFAKQRNILFMAQLVEQHALPENSAIELAGMQTDDESLKNYLLYVGNLFRNKDISLATSYMLAWQYIDVRQHVLSFIQSVNTVTYLASTQLQNQFNQLVKDKIILQNSRDYFMSVQQERGVLKVNGSER